MISIISVRYRPPKDEDVEKIRNFLVTVKKFGCRIITSKDDENLFHDIAEYVSEKEEYDVSDLVIAFGGDGTIIKAAREFSPYGTPVLGVNTGTLGYLAELSPYECELIEKVINEDFRIDERMMLDVTIHRNGDTISPELPALNEIVLANGPVSRLFKYDLYSDGVQIQSARADGIIIATPTGSTAYSLSAGGPIADPSLECIIATPICPFTLNQRPVIYGSNTNIEICSVSCRENNIYLTVDGADIFRILPDDSIKIKKSSISAKLVRLRNRSFLEILHEKMS